MKCWMSLEAGDMLETHRQSDGKLEQHWYSDGPIHFDARSVIGVQQGNCDTTIIHFVGWRFKTNRPIGDVITDLRDAMMGS